MSNILRIVYEKLSKLNIPVAYGYFDKSEDIYIPFIVYKVTKHIISADGDIYTYKYEFNIEFYYKNNMLNLEEQFREIIHEIKSVADFEQTNFDNHLMLRVRFELLENELKENING